MSNVSVILLIMSVIALVGAYFLYKNTPKIENHHKAQHT
ncbi:hypothetical protein SPBRAN_501 [uncultured Candidatus Thioglobus sp.]|nr:hypothetical protein SPBRAN_501 [uncultured Candidatus Thioglobus sp.]